MSTPFTIAVDRAVDDADTPDDDALCRTMARVLDRHLDGPASLDLRLVDSTEMRALNHRFRGRDAATNVLSFPADIHPAVGLNHLGDIVVCGEVVAREAKEQGKVLGNHWAHMVVHGTLHLLGFDHEHDDDAEIMEREEIAILADAGIADPYR